MELRKALESLRDHIGQDELLEWVYFLLIVMLAFLLLRWVQSLITKRLPGKASSVLVFELWKALLKATTRLFLIGIALFFGTRFVELSEQVENLFMKVAMITFWIAM